MCEKGYDHMHRHVHRLDVKLKLNLTRKIVCVSGYARYQPSGRIINWSSARSAKLEQHHLIIITMMTIIIIKQILMKDMHRFLVVIPDCW